MKRATPRLPLLLLLALLAPQPSAGAELSKDLVARLEKATYVYISSTRKDGSLSRPAEIWFFYDKGAIYIGTPRKSWRVKRIGAGRPQAKIWVGDPSGARKGGVSEKDLAGLPSFMAKGEVVNDPATWKLLRETFAKKYASDGWDRHGPMFQFEDGNRVVVKYTPNGS